MVNVSIEIADHDTECTSYYQVEYKLPSDPNYTPGANQFDSPIVITNLQSDTVYEFKITRFCCNGQYSTPLTFTRSTSPLDTPTGFTATPGDTQITLTWDDMADATNYIIDRADDSGFTTGLTEVYNGAHVASHNDTGLTNGQQYYYRIKSQASGYADSDYAYDDATPTP